MLRAIRIVSLLSVLSVPLDAQGRQGGQRRSGPPVEYRTNVPPIELNVLVARPTSTEVTLSLLSRTDRTTTITLQPSGRSVRESLRAGVPREVILSSLSPNQRYRYQLVSSDTTIVGSFQTARDQGAPFRFAIQADSHLDGNTDPAVYAAALRNILADSVDFLMDLGDTFMTDKYPDFHDAASQYAAQRYYFGLIGPHIPTYLVVGNHDGESARQGRGSADRTTWSMEQRTRLFPPVRENAFYRAGTPTQNYYAWQWGDARFIVLDPFSSTIGTDRAARASGGWGWTLGRTQYEWLRSTLASNRARYTFVFIHHLVGGSGAEARGGAEASAFYEWGGANDNGTSGFATQRPGWAMPIHELLRQHHVTAVFHGHDHLYVHQQRDGIAYQEVPQPGFSRDGGTRSAADYGYLSGTVLGSPGHLRVTVAASTVTVAYVKSSLRNDNGRIVDRYDLPEAGTESQTAPSVAQAPAPTASTASRFTLVSPVAIDGGTLPSAHTCDGAGTSPPLSWTDAPGDTKAFALLMSTVPRDGGTKWNWVMYGIPASVRALEVNTRDVGVFGVGSDGPSAAYQPPCSQGPGPKRYTFTLYALPRALNVGTTRVTGAMLADSVAHVATSAATFSVTYTRAPRPPATPRSPSFDHR